LSISQIANKPISILKNSTISDAIRMLLNTKISRLIVVDDEKHVGIITVKFNEDLASACEILLKNNVSGLVVLDGNNSISGIFSKTDAIRARASI